MSEIHVSCKDQVLKITEAPIIASGGVNETKVIFSFCEKWDGFVKTAVFYVDADDPKGVILDENDTCILPWEVCATNGSFYITVFGNKDDIRRTSSVIKYKVGKGVVVDETYPSDPTPEVYDQIIAMLRENEQVTQNFIREAGTSVYAAIKATENANAAVQDLVEKRDSGFFKGEKGDPCDKDAVLYTEQALSENQKAQARKNIGAPSQAEADFFHSRLVDGMLVLADTKTGDDYNLSVNDGKLKMEGATFLTNEEQELTDAQKAQVRDNIGAGSKVVEDALSARLANGAVTLEDRDGNVESLFLDQDNLYMTVRDKVETVLTTGYQYLTEEQKAQARKNIHAQEVPSKLVAHPTLEKSLDLDDFGTAEVNGVVYPTNVEFWPKLAWMDKIEDFDFALTMVLGGESYTIEKADCTVTSTSVGSSSGWKVSSALVDGTLFTITQSGNTTTILLGGYNPSSLDLKLYSVEYERVDASVVTAVDGIEPDENGNVKTSAVSYNKRQSLDITQKELARKNINAASVDDVIERTEYDGFVDDDITSTLTFEKGYYYGTFGKVTDANGNVHCTNLIPVKTGDKFKITTTYGWATVLVAEFDSTQTMVSYHGLNNDGAVKVTDYEYTVPSGISYIAINNRYQENSPMVLKKVVVDSVKHRIAELEKGGGGAGAGTGNIPTKLPNPNKLTFTGAVNAEYDGSEAVEVNIPAGGGGGAGWNLVADLTVEEEVKRLSITPENGKTFAELGYTEVFILYRLLGKEGYSSRYSNLSVWYCGGWAGGNNGTYSNSANGYDGFVGSIYAIAPPRNDTAGFNRIGRANGSGSFLAGNGIESVNMESAAGFVAGSRIVVYGR